MTTLGGTSPTGRAGGLRPEPPAGADFLTERWRFCEAMCNRPGLTGTDCGESASDPCQIEAEPGRICPAVEVFIIRLWELKHPRPRCYM